ncbi:MAG: hypothetical protein IID44_07895 [Planctomycetes bacterium]|nr:hypothetical protein [Planctomycetota bacterium]
MIHSITIEDLDPETLRRIAAEARRRGINVEQCAAELLKQQVSTCDKSAGTGSKDLLSLAGTWSGEDEAAFNTATANFSRVD